MNESTKTKKAFRGSLFALFLCIVLLIGMTFAWFTDIASTGVNKIQAGNLKVDLQMKDANGSWVSAEGKTIDFIKASGHENEAILWEPGCTYELPVLRIVNKGNLALKYKIKINGIQGDEKLNEVINWTISDVALDTDHSLAAGATSEDLTIKGHMQESAGNEYQGLSIDGISITVYATQDTVENDSFNNQYDANATSADELKAALKNGGDINISKNIYTDNTDSIDARMIISKPTTLNLDKKIISPDNMGNNQTNFTALIVSADTTINASDEGGIDTGTNGGYGINVKNGAKLTINGGYYYGGGTAVQVQSGTAIINGGTFACEPYSNPTYGYNFLMNCIDSAYKDGTAKIVIKGGTFINFNPADCKAEGAGTNFVAEGYKVVSEAHGSDTWYKVVKE